MQVSLINEQKPNNFYKILRKFFIIDANQIIKINQNGNDMKNYRISAAGIVLHDNKILLVRYKFQDEKSFLVGPGGGVEIEEDMHQALVREVWEETGLEVKPGKMLLVEDLLSKKYRMVKIWFLCSVAGGQLSKTEEAAVEGIVDVNWYDKEQLRNEIVYPSIIMEADWNAFYDNNWQPKYLSLSKAKF